MSNRNNTLIALFAGLAAGAALGLLFAPDSGKKTRERIKKKGDKAGAELKEVIAAGREKWSEAKGKAVDAATMTKAEVDEFVEFLFDEGKDLWDRMGNDETSARDRAREKTNKS